MQFLFEKLEEVYETHQTEICNVKLHPDLSPLTELITERGAALEVSTARYVKSRIQDRSEQVTAALLQKGIANAIYGIQQIGAIAIGSLSTSPSHQPHFTREYCKRNEVVDFAVISDYEKRKRPHQLLFTRLLATFQLSPLERAG